MITRKEKIIEAMAQRLGEKLPASYREAARIAYEAIEAEGCVVVSREPRGWRWRRTYENGGYTEKVTAFWSDAWKLANSDEHEESVDIIEPLYSSSASASASASEQDTELYDWRQSNTRRPDERFRWFDQDERPPIDSED